MENDAAAAARRLLSEESADVRHRAIAVCALEDPARLGCSFFAEILAEADDPMMMWYAIRAIGELRCESADAGLLEVLFHPDVELGSSSLHRITAWAAGKIGSRLRTPLLALLHHHEPSVVKAAADALGEIGPDEDTAAALAGLVADHEWDVALWAALALRKGGRVSTPAITRVLPTLDGARALLLIDTLARTGDPDGCVALFQAKELFPEAFAAYLTPDRRSALRAFLSQSVLEINSSGRNAAALLLADLGQSDGEVAAL